MGIYGYMDIFNHKGIVKLLAEGLPGIHQRFIPKKRFVCSRESTKTLLAFFSWKWCRRNVSFKITCLPSLQ